MKRNLILFICALVIMGMGAILLVVLKSHQKLGAPGVRVANIPLFDKAGKQVATQSVELPENVSGFHGTPSPMSSAVLDVLPKDTTFGCRIYRADDGFDGM